MTVAYHVLSGMALKWHLTHVDNYEVKFLQK